MSCDNVDCLAQDIATHNWIEKKSQQQQKHNTHTLYKHVSHRDNGWPVMCVDLLEQLFFAFLEAIMVDTEFLCKEL